MIGYGAAGYAALVGLMYSCQRSFLYYPGGEPPPPAGAGVPEMAALTVRTADGLDLTGWYAPPAAPEGAVIVLFQGNAGNIADRAFKARPFLDAGYGVLLAGYRGYGGNPGRPSEEGLYDDARAALAYLRRAGIEAGRIVLYGESLGTGIAVRMASETRVGALVLEAPYTSMADVAQTHYPFLPARILTRDRFESAARIADVGVPLLVLHGERDTVVPARLGRELLAAAREPKEGVFVAEAGHNDLYAFGAAEVVLVFLRRHLDGAGKGGN